MRLREVLSPIFRKKSKCQYWNSILYPNVIFFFEKKKMYKFLFKSYNSSFNEKDCWRKLVQNLYFTYQPFVFFKNFFVFLFLWWISRFRFKYWNNGFDNSWTWWFLKYWNETKVQIVQTLTPNQRVWFFYQFKCVIFM